MSKKKIQIAVTIDETGNFNSCAITSTIDRDDALAFSCECLEGACLRQYILHAEVDVPDATPIEATVEAVEEVLT
jgi:hypothetical protein